MSKLNFTTAKICIGLIFCYLLFQEGSAQSIKLIPNPDAGNKTGTSYIVYNNQLYTGYTEPAGRVHLARWNGAGLTVIANPDNGIGFADFPILFDNKLCFRYLNQTNKYQLAQYDGSSITLVSNPDNGHGFNGDRLVQPAPTIFKGKLYIQYLTSTAYRLAAFDGSNLHIVSTKDSLLNYVGAPIIYNNEFYSVWATQNQTDQLVAYDGTTFRIIPNPTNGYFIGLGLNYDNGESNVQYPHPIIYNSKLYLTYHDNNLTNDYENQLAQYDGSSISLISNPTNDAIFGVYYNDPIIYNNKLYVNYYRATDTSSNGDSSIRNFDNLGQFDGQRLVLIPNPDSSYIAMNNTKFVVYNNQLYFDNEIFYRGGNQLYLTSFNGIKDSLIPHSGIGNVEETMPAIYHDKLFFAFNYNLAQYDGHSISLINNLSDGAYKEYPFVFNDTLFFVYQSFSTFHLAYIDDGTLAVNYLKFSAQLQQNNAILNWQTSSEINTSIFNIQRSSDGVHFTTINKITAAGSSSNIENYTYTDNNITILKINKLYYRLQEIDKDGKSTYSNIQLINFTNSSLFTITPNPVKDYINVVASENIANAQISITDMNGRILYSAKQNFAAGGQIKIATAQFAKQMLLISINANNNKQQFKVVKE